jgi:AcrR family transcriptional regulator
MRSLRVYGGVQGDDRRAERRAQLVDAGLDLLGSGGGEPALTVRGACKRAGLTARYFYESFADRNALELAVYDHVIDEIAHTALEAIAAAPREATAMARAGLGTIVRTVADDPRKGRLLFSVALSSDLLAERRTRSSRLFAHLLRGQAQDFYGFDDAADLEPTAQFLVGGLAQTLTAWLDGAMSLTGEELVERCTRIFLAVGDAARNG